MYVHSVEEGAENFLIHFHCISSQNNIIINETLA